MKVQMTSGEPLVTRKLFKSSGNSQSQFQHLRYGKCSKISNILHSLFLNKMLVSRGGIHKMVVRIANWEDPDRQQNKSIYFDNHFIIAALKTNILFEYRN